jgi:hypothetical protein
MLLHTIKGLAMTSGGFMVVMGDDWCGRFSTLNFGVVSGESGADRIVC